MSSYRGIHCADTLRPRVDAALLLSQVKQVQKGPLAPQKYRVPGHYIGYL